MHEYFKFVIIAGALILGLVFWGTVFVVGWHFVLKYWLPHEP